MIKQFIVTLLIGYLGGFVFTLINFPLPWVLGALTFIILFQGLTKTKANWPDPLKQGGFLILGMYFGLYFTMEIIGTIGPYLLPYLVMTCILILASAVFSIAVTKWIAVDKITSVFGSIPGGLSEMVLASEAMKANTSFVVIFQTVRLLTVLFTVPAIIIYLFGGGERFGGTVFVAMPSEVHLVSYLWFLLPITGGILFRNKIPAGIVVVPMIIMAAMNISSLEVATVPPFVLLSAQVAVGIGLGKNISFQDLKLGGKYCFVYLGVSLAIIAVSFGLGVLLAYWTGLDVATAILSIAPGGLIEMVLTASTIGANPAVVTALQMMRILMIIIFVPSLLKWYFRKEKEQHAA